MDSLTSRGQLGQSAAQRQLIEGTLAGLRFVRNQAGGEADLAEFIQAAAPGLSPGNGRITDWRWKPVPLPVLVSLPPRHLSCGWLELKVRLQLSLACRQQPGVQQVDGRCRRGGPDTRTEVAKMHAPKPRNGQLQRQAG